MNTRILCINPGSTSTKIALYDNEIETFCDTVCHHKEELSQYKTIFEQLDMRTNAVLSFIGKHKIPIESISAVVGRGGLLPPVKSGAYLVNDAMIHRLRTNPMEPHASNLGAAIAKNIADTQGINSYIYDSVAVDELCDFAKTTGFPEATRRCLNHTLNTRAVAHRCAKEKDTTYSDSTFIVVHLGGSITASLHNKGRITDYVDNDEGAFGPESCGRMGVRMVLKLVRQYDMAHMVKRTRGSGGVCGYLGTTDVRQVEHMIDDGDKKAEFILNTMSYQVSKSIGELAPAVEGKIDNIIITGGIAHSKRITDDIIKRVSFIAPVVVYPGEDEMQSLAFGIRRVLTGEEPAREYIEEEEV